MSSTLHPSCDPFISWFDWAPDPHGAWEAHDPTLEPYASMTKDQLLEAMAEAKGSREWDFLQEFFLDKCTDAELSVDRSTFVREQFGVLGEDLLVFLSGVAGMATRVAPGRSANRLYPWL